MLSRIYIWGAGGKLPAAGEFEGAQKPPQKKQRMLSFTRIAVAGTYTVDKSGCVDH